MPGCWGPGARSGSRSGSIRAPGARAVANASLRRFAAQSAIQHTSIRPCAGSPRAFSRQLRRCNSVICASQPGIPTQRPHPLPSTSDTTPPSPQPTQPTPCPLRPALPRYGGFCACCGRSHFLRPTPATLAAAAALRTDLDEHGRIDFDLAPQPGDPDLHIDYVWTKGPGRMFGVMLAYQPDGREGSGGGGGRGDDGGGGGSSADSYGVDGMESRVDSSCGAPPAGMTAAAAAAAGGGGGGGGGGSGGGGGRLVVLKAFSGQMTNRWHVPGWVGPVAGVINSTPLYVAYRTLTEAHSARLAALDRALLEHHHLANPQRQQEQLDTSTTDTDGQSAPPCAASKQPLTQKQMAKQRNQVARQRQRAASATATAAAVGSAGGGRDGRGGAAGALAFLDRQRQLLRGRRRALSHELLRAIQRSYCVANLRGEPLQLLRVYDCAVRRQRYDSSSTSMPVAWGACEGARAVGAMDGAADGSGESRAASLKPQTQRHTPAAVVRVALEARAAAAAAAAAALEAKAAAAAALAFPAGTGDCCAPKLLWAAQQRGLVPVGLVEFWYGSPPNTATPQGRRSSSDSGNSSHGSSGGDGSSSGRLQQETRVHGAVYGPCDKCEIILGSMLCGVEEEEEEEGAMVRAAGGLARLLQLASAEGLQL